VKLSIVGTGLASPRGLTPQDHAFFIRAGAPMPHASPFLRRDEEPVRVAMCPWLPANLYVAERLEQLAMIAIEDALFGLIEVGGARRRMDLVLTLGNPRSGLTTDDHAEVLQAVASQVPGMTTRVALGAASTFAALANADAAIANGETEAVVLVAADSFISIPALTDIVEHPASPWSKEPPPPSEAAAALVVMAPTQARRTGAMTIATLDYAAVAEGSSSDDDDETVDGNAMSALFWKMPKTDPAIGSVFGQSGVDALRETEWQIALARAASRFDANCSMVTLESEIGHVGAAIGAANVVYAIACLRHDVLAEQARNAPFVAWAIGRDGKRGIALGTVAR
jgi:hypothetical protein